MTSTSPVKAKTILNPQSLPYSQFENGQFTLPPPQLGIRREVIKQDYRTLTGFYIGGVIILLLSSLSCLIALYRNTQLMEQNLQLIEKQIEIQMKCKDNIRFPMPMSLLGRIRRDIKPEECPPCETPPTNPIQPYRNPVSVLNEDPRVGKKANYTAIHNCRNPPIHVAVLKILNDTAFEKIEWSGKGRNKQSAKQAAAWRCIEAQFPDLKPQVAEEYIPSPYNPPSCNDELKV